MKLTESQFVRLEAFRMEGEAGAEKKRIVGSASTRKGDTIINLRLFTLVNENFYVVVSKEDPEKYLVMTREQNLNPRNPNLYRWHIVGQGKTYPGGRIVQLNFDLFDKPIYLKLEPDYEREKDRKAS